MSNYGSLSSSMRLSASILSKALGSIKSIPEGKYQFLTTSTTPLSSISVSLGVSTWLALPSLTSDETDAILTLSTVYSLTSCSSLVKITSIASERVFIFLSPVVSLGSNCPTIFMFIFSSIFGEHSVVFKKET